MNTIGSAGGSSGTSMLDMFIKNNQGKGKGKAGKSSVSGSSQSAGFNISSSFGDMVNLSSKASASISINASFSANASVSGGRVEFVDSYHINSSTTWKPLPSLTDGYADLQSIPPDQRPLTKANPPEMSEEDFENAIKELARKHAEGGDRNGMLNEDYIELRHSYTSVVSPDREGLINNAAKTMSVPANMDYNAANVYDEKGDVCATYNQHGWNSYLTKDEAARSNQFYSIYKSAFDEALATKGE